MAKLTNGTGSFIDLNIGENSVVMDGADTVVAWKINGKICYAIEDMPLLPVPPSSGYEMVLSLSSLLGRLRH